MTIALFAVTGVTIVLNAGIGIADLAGAAFVRANSAAVGVPAGWLPMLGALKVSGAVGLVVGLLGIPALGVAAAIGLVLFFIGAVIAHMRARVLHNIAVPGCYLALAAASLVLLLAR